MSKFEVGKWYKCTYNNNYYKYRDGNFNSSEIINPTNTTEDCCRPGLNEGRNNRISYLFKEQLNDLSVIQQYLPDGHVDKIPESQPLFPIY
jgi:hypothetical protein